MERRKRAKLLVLGTGAKRTTASSPAALLLLTPGDGGVRPRRLYESALPVLRHQLIGADGERTEQLLRPLPSRLVRVVLSALRGRLSAGQLEHLERILPEGARRELAEQWEPLCRHLSANLPPPMVPLRAPHISWAAYYRILQQIQEERVQWTAERVREGYQREELPQRALKVIGARRNVTTLEARRPPVTQPLSGVKAASSLMRRARRETINARPAPSSSIVKPRLIPPRR